MNCPVEGCDYMWTCHGEDESFLTAYVLKHIIQNHKLVEAKD